MIGEAIEAFEAFEAIEAFEKWRLPFCKFLKIFFLASYDKFLKNYDNGGENRSRVRVPDLYLSSFSTFHTKRGSS